MILHEGYARERARHLEIRLRGLVHSERVVIADLRLSPPVGRIGYAEAQGLAYRQVALGEQLGPAFATQWLRVRGTVPPAWASSRVDLLLDTRSEATVWVDGRAVQGLHSGRAQLRGEATLVQRAAGGEQLAVEIEIACQDTFGYGDPDQDGGTRGPYRSVSPFVLDRCELGRFDPEAWAMLWDLVVLRELEAEAVLDPGSAGRLLARLDVVCERWETGDRRGAAQLLSELREQLAGGLPHELSAIGHAHLDTAWLWPIGETWRKLQRTFSTQVRLIDEYPEYLFAASQAQHYAWVAERDPALWQELRERVRRGRWIPVGGTWIEPDCNLPSGESLARQFLHGQRFFEREFGRRCTELWQPDAFGFTGQLPQLMRLAGITRFLTQKLSWNRYNEPEHHSFIWQGIDGSEVLAHFPPADTYNADATVAEVVHSMRAYRDHPRTGDSMLVFGYGDGGGGPTREMLERLRRMRDLRGLPQAVMRTPEAFFGRLEQSSAGLRTIVGELYFELHRGTYTTQALVKRGNRRCELALHDAELLGAVAARRAGVAYPRAELGELWRTLLVNQFHDILPGSSIAEVGERARAELAAVERRAQELATDALDALARAGAAIPPAITGAATGARTEAAALPVNTAAFARREVATAPDGSLVLVTTPPCGIGVALGDADPGVTVIGGADGGAVLENEHLTVSVNAGGAIVSVVHRESGRETLAAPANRLELYVDDPVTWDAWDVDPAHLAMGADCAPAAGIAELTSHPLRGEAVFERVVGERSTLRQTVRLDAGARRVEVHTAAAWHEDHRLLKVAFPLAVHAPYATYETAFGATVRPTHFSTRRDLARYEVPGHRWVDLSEHGFGAAILTDSKYGYSVYGNTVRVSLLRASKYPDPGADMGDHAFVYALAPHAGTWQEGHVAREARSLTMPILWAAAAPGSWASVSPGSLVLDTIKLAEDSDALVVRCYEAYGGRGRAHVRLTLPHSRARRSNLLEDDLGALPLDDDGIRIDYRPWEIVTILVE